MQRYLSIGLVVLVCNAAQALAQNPQYSVIGRSLAVTHDQAVGGLKEALLSGVQVAVRELGHENGFLTNLNVRIPMPEQLQAVERTLRAVHEDKLADDFVAAMNHAAEQAVPQAVSVFTDAISRMTLADAESILTGPPVAATQYFRQTEQTNLFEQFLPVVKKATDATGVTSDYKRVLQLTESNKYLAALLGAFSHSESLDLDAYITNKAMDGLFKEMALQEQLIRQNPVARTSDLLRKVFGAITG
jgi:hypothetical protein